MIFNIDFMIFLCSIFLSMIYLRACLKNGGGGGVTPYEQQKYICFSSYFNRSRELLLKHKIFLKNCDFSKSSALDHSGVIVRLQSFN